MEPLKITKHIEYDEEYEIERDERGKLLEPNCPGCGVKVGRPKCFWEDPNCPRHDLKSVWREAMKDNPTNHDFHKNGYRPDECYYCGQSEEAHESS